jgi:hypothetical protein
MNLESDGELVKSKRQNSLLILKDPRTAKYLASFKHPVILPYKSHIGTEKYCNNHGFVLACADRALLKIFNNKTRFRKHIAKLGLHKYIPPYVQFKPVTSSYTELVSQLETKELVLQIGQSEGGRGTFFVNSPEDFTAFLEDPYVKKMASKRTFIASSFIDGISASVSAIATKWGTFHSPIQIQINDSVNKGVFAGHDWTLSKTYVPDLIQQKAQDFVQSFGAYLYSMGFKGFFGIDFLITKDTCYAIECNPRITGAFPVPDMIQEFNDRTEFMTLHLLEFITAADEVQLDYDAIQMSLAAPAQKLGSHFLIPSLLEKGAKFSTNLTEGTYTLENSTLRYVDARNHLADLKASEFIIAELPTKDSFIAPRGRLCRIVSQEQVLHNDAKTLNDWAQSVTSLVRNEFTS